MKEVTTFKDGSLKVEFDGTELRVHLNDYNSKSYKTLNDAIYDLGSLLGMVTKAVAVGKKRLADSSNDGEAIDLDSIPF